VSYELPVAVDAVNVYPHAHYIGKKLLAWATLPDGSTKWLLRIQDWDFSWQDQYYYAEPVSLPAGTTLTGRFTYDNSADNPNNPNHPPQRMISGNRSTEEMGSISFEVILRRREDRDVLRESLLRQDLANWPKHWRLNSLLGALLVNRGDHEQAAEFLWRALKLNPDDATGLNNLGVTLAHSGNHRGAQSAFNRALNLRPQYPDAHYNLGVELAALGKTDEAIAHYTRALDVRSYDADVHNNLGVALAMQSRFELATSHFRRALDIEPDSVDARGNLGNMFLKQGRYDEAVRHYRRALESRPDSEILQTNLSIALQRQTAGDTLQDSTRD
jgi:Flp pilus assembly protein TadD